GAWKMPGRMARKQAIAMPWNSSINEINDRRVVQDDRARNETPVKKADPASLIVPKALARQLLALYNYPDPRRRGRTIRGYDRPHALRTARMCATVARRLGHPDARLYSYQIACVFQDLGRAGLDQKLFGKFWLWAGMRGIPKRSRRRWLVLPM